MRINLVCVGKLKEKYWTEAVKEYVKRVSRYAELNIIELDEERTLEAEGKNIIKKLEGVIIVTDIGGKMLSSEQFAQYVADGMVKGKSVFTVVIGSSCGLCDEVKKLADLRISYGLATYPHQLMRVIMCEQIYRAIAINNNLTYHK